MESDLQHAEAEQGALEPTGVSGIPISSRSSSFGIAGDLLDRPALDELGQHGGRCLADRAAAALEADRLDPIAAVESEPDRDLVAAERVLAVRPRVGRVEHAVVPRVLVVVEDDLAVEVVRQREAGDVAFSLASPSTRRSTSSGRL